MIPHSIWKDKKVRQQLGWYYDVMLEEKPAKFLICKSIPTTLDIKDSNLQDLWQEHGRLSVIFKQKLNQIKTEKQKIKLDYAENNFLALKSEIANRSLTSCNFCEWNCKVDRTIGKVGVCRLDKITRVGSWFRHFGEEPPLVNSNGSGTIFFTGCMFRCVFCQNWDISQFPLAGTEVDGKKLAFIMRNLYEEGASNINFVGGEPTPNIHTILEGLNQLDVNIPMLWNSDMYGTVEAMNLLADVIDIWLPDFKYGNNNCARKLSNVPNYFEVVARNHIIASKNGDMIIRHLVMPGHLECCTKPILNWIAQNCKDILVNIMGQYHPDYKVAKYPDKYPEIARTLRSEELELCFEYAKKLGLVYEPLS